MIPIRRREATALIIFVKAMQVLGVDLSRFIPSSGKERQDRAQIARAGS